MGLGTGRSARECHWTPRPVAARRPALPRRHSGPKRDRTVGVPPKTKPGPERGLGDLQARARFVPRAGKAPQGSSALRGQPEAQGPRAQSPSHLPVPVGLGLGLRMVDGLWIHAGTGRCPSQWPDGLHGFAVARVLFAARAPIVSAPRLRRSNLSGWQSAGEHSRHVIARKRPIASDTPAAAASPTARRACSFCRAGGSAVSLRPRRRQRRPKRTHPRAR